MSSLTPAVAAEPPTLEQVREWIQVTSAVVSDEQLQIIIDAETAAQAVYCTTSPWAAPLSTALLRRCARSVAALGLPLGVIDAAGEAGAATLPRYDVEIERLERPYRKVVLG